MVDGVAWYCSSLEGERWHSGGGVSRCQTLVPRRATRRVCLSKYPRTAHSANGRLAGEVTCTRLSGRRHARHRWQHVTPAVTARLSTTQLPVLRERRGRQAGRERRDRKVADSRVRAFAEGGLTGCSPCCRRAVRVQLGRLRCRGTGPPRVERQLPRRHLLRRLRPAGGVSRTLRAHPPQRRCLVHRLGLQSDLGMHLITRSCTRHVPWYRSEARRSAEDRLPRCRPATSCSDGSAHPLVHGHGPAPPCIHTHSELRSPQWEAVTAAGLARSARASCCNSSSLDLAACTAARYVSGAPSSSPGFSQGFAVCSGSLPAA